MKFSYTIIYVRDVPKAVQFYEQAFGLTRRFVHKSQQYAEMNTGTTALAFASYEAAKMNVPSGVRAHELDKAPAAFEIAFTTQDVAAALNTALKAGAREVSRPVEKPWGQTVAYVRDPDGVLVEIATPMAAGQFQ